MSQDLTIKVRAALYKAGMKQTDLANILEISESYLSDIIRGKKDGPKAQIYVEKIKKILKIS